MPSSAVRTFTDPDDYASAIRATTSEISITGRGHFDAELVRIDLHRLWMQRFSDNLPRIIHAACVPARAMVQFRTAPGPSLLWGGAEMRPTDIVRHSDGESTFQRSSGSAFFASMSLPTEDLAAVGEAFAADDLTPPPNTMLVTPSPSAMARLQRMHAAAARLAEDAPEIIAHPEAARGLEQALVEALVECLSMGQPGEDRTTQRRHSLIMRRFREAVEENAEEPVYMPELCAAIGVPERTLRVCCQEQLGMTPKHYLILRRMHLARRALRNGISATTSVTEVATRYGFWQFGRFAGEYKSLFGEAPSATLRRPRW
jgi:AraC-like DNA-binding protein